MARGKRCRGDELHLRFDCPGCKSPHVVPITGPKAWGFNGNWDLPTLTPSVLLHGNPTAPRCHSFVTDGRIRFLADCTHEFAGQTVDLPEID